VNAIANSKPANFPPSRRATLWYDPVDKSVFSWGGWTYNTTAKKGIWAFKPDGRGGAVWEERYSPSEVDVTPSFGALTSFSPTSLYSLGGCLFDDEPSVHSSISGLTVFDFQHKVWKNISSTGYSSSGYGVLGESEFVPLFGQNGLLLALGGESPPNQTYLYESGTALRDMSDISVYDIHANQWYHQTATGDIPPGRSEFCMVGAQQKDNSSYEL
jgi:hypothetical protein